jgi:hypothetical protein
MGFGHWDERVHPVTEAHFLLTDRKRVPGWNQRGRLPEKNLRRGELSTQP